MDTERRKRFPIILEFIPIIGLFFSKKNNGLWINGKPSDKLEDGIFYWQFICVLALCVFIFLFIEKLKQ